MATLVSVTVAMWVLFVREFFGKPVFTVRVNRHKYKMRLLLVWGPRFGNESRSVEDFHYLHSLFVFLRSENQVSSCVIVQLEYVFQFEP